MDPSSDFQTGLTLEWYHNLGLAVSGAALLAGTRPAISLSSPTLSSPASQLPQRLSRDLTPLFFNFYFLLHLRSSVCAVCAVFFVLPLWPELHRALSDSQGIGYVMGPYKEDKPKQEGSFGGFGGLGMGGGGDEQAMMDMIMRQQQMGMGGGMEGMPMGMEGMGGHGHGMQDMGGQGGPPSLFLGSV